MRWHSLRAAWTFAIATVLGVGSLRGSLEADDQPYSRQEDVVYGRKYGTALTLDVITPQTGANGIGVIWCVSGGWYSAHEAIRPASVRRLLERGYTLFAVIHGSQPKFAIPEVLEDMHRATRFVRANAKKYGVDPEKLGIVGGSAGGHLSLMQGVAGRSGNPLAPDPIERVSSKVQAVACFFPPTDFLNYGEPGAIALGRGVLKNFQAPFAFTTLDTKKNLLVTITDEQRILAIGKDISPVYHVNSGDAPALIIHGDADKLVPIQQAQLMIERLQKEKIPCSLVTKKGMAHGWPKLDEDFTLFADWFDQHLRHVEKKPVSKK